MKAAIVIPGRPARPGEVSPARLVAGRPLIVRAVEAARACPSASAVCVCGGDDESLSLARAAGAEAVSAPAAPDPDDEFTRLAPLLRHALRHLESLGGLVPDAVLWASPFFPLIEPSDWEGAIAALAGPEAGRAFSAVEPAGAVWSRGPTGAGVLQPGGFLIDAGAFRAFRAAPLLRDAALPAGGAVPRLLSREKALEARTPADLQAAEYVLRSRERDAAARAIPRPLGAIVFDFDGVFTDNRVVVFQDGREAAVCDRADGWGLGQLKKKLAVPILVLSTERNPIVRARCEKLRLECINDVPDKLVVLREWLARRRIDPASVAYVGNDDNDLTCMRAVGCPVAVGDAYPQVKAVARVVLSAPGGRGAVREFTELVVAAFPAPPG